MPEPKRPNACRAVFLCGDTLRHHERCHERGHPPDLERCHSLAFPGRAKSSSMLRAVPDIAFRFLRRAKTGHATVLDLTEPMLIEGRKRAEAERLADSLEWVVGDAMALPFESNTFDVYTISFGIRNVTRPADALSEAFRVLKPGGRLMVLEFSHIPNEGLQLYDLYSFNVIPRLGQAIANDKDSYQYLVESIRKFPDQETFLTMVENAGFGNAKYRNLSMGVACLHSAWKL